MGKKVMFFVLFYAIILNTGCKKECKKINTFPEQFLRSWYFEKDSWWIYKAKDSLELYDTVRVKYNSRGQGGYNDDTYYPCTDYAHIGITHSSNKFYNFPNSSVQDFSSYYSDTQKAFGCESYFLNISPPTQYFLIFSISNNSFISGTESNWNFIGVEQLNLSQYSFTNAIHYECASSLHLYFVQDVGIVKIKASSGTEWDLYNYFINNNN